MRRRDFVRGMAVSTAWSLAARAQQAPKPMRRIGYLAFRAPLIADDAFLERLGSLGWIEGQNVFIDRRFAAGDMELLKKSAVELVHVNVDVILACASVAAKTAKDATSSIPIVFAATGDPVGQGFVANLAHPGVNYQAAAIDYGDRPQRIPRGRFVEPRRPLHPHLLASCSRCGGKARCKSNIRGGV